MVWLSISPVSFPALVVRSMGAASEVGEIGREEQPYLVKISTSVRICIVREDAEGWGRSGGVVGKLEMADGGFADGYRGMRANLTCPRRGNGPGRKRRTLSGWESLEEDGGS